MGSQFRRVDALSDSVTTAMVLDLQALSIRDSMLPRYHLWFLCTLFVVYNHLYQILHLCSTDISNRRSYTSSPLIPVGLLVNMHIPVPLPNIQDHYIHFAGYENVTLLRYAIDLRKKCVAAQVS
jgi:hypothetical protein